MPHLIAVDWGTSSLRGARLDAAGRVLEEKSAPLDQAMFLRGVMRAGEGNGLLHDAFGVRALALFDRLSRSGRHARDSGGLAPVENRGEVRSAGRLNSRASLSATW